MFSSSCGVTVAWPAFDPLSTRPHAPVARPARHPSEHHGPAYTAGVLDIAVLGPLVVHRDGHRIAVRGATQRTVLALLVLHRWTPVSADRLIDELWGDRGPHNPRNALQQSIVKLRAALGRDDEAVITDQGGYRLDRAGVHLDVSRFEALVEDGRWQSAAGDHAAAQRRFREALALWRGHPFAELRDVVGVDAEIARLEELRLLAIEGRIEADLTLVRPETVAVELGPLLEAHPLRERLWRHLVVALYRAGRQADALDAYQRARITLIEQVGVEPGADLQHVHGLVLARDPSLLPPRRPAVDMLATSTYELLSAVRTASAALAYAGRHRDHADLVLAYVRALNRQPAAYVHDLWLGAFDAAHDRITAAITWAVEHDRVDTALGLAVETARYWDHRQLLDTAHATLALVVAADPTPSSTRSEALTWLAFIAAEQGDTDGALHALDEAVADARQAEDPAREAGASAIASVVLRGQDPAASARRASHAVDLFVTHGTRREIAYGWTTHALAALAAGDPQTAEASARAATAIYAELGDRRGLAWTRATQSSIATALGLDDEADALRTEARTVALDVEDIRAVRRLD